MGVRKMIGNGTILQTKGTTESTTGWVTIGGLLTLPGPDATAPAIDTTTLDSTDEFITKQRGFVDSGQMNMTAAYGSTDSGSGRLGTLLASGEIVDWRIIYPSTLVAKQSFEGFLSGLGKPDHGRGSMIMRSMIVDVTGSPGYPST